MQEINLSQQFHDIISNHKGILYKVARTYCLIEDERQDLIQEIMIHIWQSLPKYNPDYKISTWLYRIAINVAISYYRKNMSLASINMPISDQISHVENEDQHDKEHQLQLLESFIADLKEIDKALILLYLEDKSHAEIADILGISIGNVGTKVGRIKDKLRQRFSHQNKY